jgi:hypothetical protein
MTRLAKWSSVCLFCAATAIASFAQTFTRLASFNYLDSGAYPQYMSLVRNNADRRSRLWGHVV